MIEIFEIEGFGFGYKGEGIYQECDPELDGFEPMTRERAEQMAAIITARIGQ